MAINAEATVQRGYPVRPKSLRWDADIVVAGGGPAGFCAAVTAGRAGANVLLIERCGFMGGNATGGLVGPFSTTFFSGTQVIAGLVDEVIDRLVAEGGSLGTQKCPYPPGTTMGTGGWITTFDPDILKAVMDEMAKEAGVRLLLHSQITAAERTADGLLRGVVFHNKSGRQVAYAQVFVDATGDGDLAAWAGTPYKVGNDGGHCQPGTLMFELSNVELNVLRQYMNEHPDEFAWHTFPRVPSEPSRVCVAGSGFLTLIREAKERGDLHLGRNRITFFSGVQDGNLKVNGTRILGVDATDAESLSQAEVNARAQMLSLFRFMRGYIPGCQHAELSRVGCYVGIRESRRIMGDYVLTKHDVLEGRRFDDAIGCGAYPIDIHSVGDVPDDAVMDGVWIELQDAYDIPYRCLIPHNVEGLLVAGRPISVTHEAMASTRLMVHCMVMGQAAGTAAAIAVQQGVRPREVSVEELQRALLRQDVFLRSDL